MSFHPSLDPESFEALLANAFEVQQSGLRPQALSAVIDLQRFIAKGDFTVDRALHRIADGALKVSNASGIAIALLESNQLVYRAGSGSAAIQVGRHVPAVLCASSEGQPEILRVENADNDSRVQADICKQFGATSLLILPIYRARAISGVLQVHFSEPHLFLDPEVRVYRLMAGLVEEAISRNLQLSVEEAAATQSAPATVVHESAFAEQFSVEPNQHPKDLAHEFYRGLTALPVKKWAEAAIEFANQFRQKMNSHLANHVWVLAAAVTAALLFAITIQLFHRHDPTRATVVSTDAAPNSTTPNFAPELINASAKIPNPATRIISPSSAFKRVRVGPNEVDYITDDVTIRQFTNRSARPLARISERQVNIGDDVTIRYFSNKSASDSQAAPVPAASQTTSQSLSR